VGEGGVISGSAISCAAQKKDAKRVTNPKKVCFIMFVLYQLFK